MDYDSAQNVSSSLRVFSICEDDIEVSVDQVMPILEQEIKLLGGRSRRVFIGGFTQTSA